MGWCAVNLALNGSNDLGQMYEVSGTTTKNLTTCLKKKKTSSG